MTIEQNGGPAFPTYDDVEYESGHAFGQMTPGMSLRDWFAGQALAGICASEPQTGDAPTAKDAAIWALEYADAMLAERNK